MEGMITRLTHLSNQTEMPTSNFSTNNNFRGFGYIDGESEIVYFEPNDLTNCQFKELSEGDRVEYELDRHMEKRAKSVTVLEWAAKR